MKPANRHLVRDWHIVLSQI